MITLCANFFSAFLFVCLYENAHLRSRACAYAHVRMHTCMMEREYSLFYHSFLQIDRVYPHGFGLVEPWYSQEQKNC